MSVLETFYILFKSDVTDVDKGAKIAKKSTTELNTSLTASQKLSKDLGKEFSAIAASFSDAVLGIVSAGAIIEGIKSAAEYATTLSHASEALHISTEALDEWGGAVGETGGSVTSFIGTVRGLQTSLNEIALRGSSSLSPFFVQLGIKALDARGKVRSVSDLLPELATSFARLGPLRARALGQEIGLDEPTISLLLRGRAEIDKIIARQKELGVVTEKQAKIAQQFGVEWDNTGHALRYIFTLIGSNTLPTFGRFLHTLQDFIIYLRNNSGPVINAFKGIGLAVGLYLTPAIASLVIAAAPLILIGGGLLTLAAAIGFVVGDIADYEKGLNSFTGTLVKNHPLVGQVIEYYAQRFTDLGNILKFITPSFNDFRAVNETIGHAIASSWGLIVKVITDSINAIIWSIEKAEEAYKKIQSFFKGGSDSNISIGQAAIAGASANPLAAMNSNTISSVNSASTRSMSVNTGQITINTQATSAQDISQMLGQHLNEQLRLTVSEFDNGVRI